MPRRGRPKPRFDDATKPLARRAERHVPLSVVVRISGARAEPPSLHLKEGRCTLGSGQGSDVVIDDPTVSRAHCELTLVPEGVALTDLGSKNGTYYLGQRVERIVLSAGASFALGDATVLVDPDPASLAGVEPLDVVSYDEMVGVSSEMRRIFGVLERLKGSLLPVLVEGESGVGKELFARALHRGSPASEGALVTLNCGAIPRDLIASELFGHKKGAFTGAVDSRRGAFENADEGTLFLDEIGELPIDVQPMLLRALETGEVRQLGSEEPRHVHVRVVAATNRDLDDAVGEGQFRQDLFYRLAVVRVRIPALRERIEDIEPLARSFAEREGVGELEASVIEQLKHRSWPGNVRELRNTIQAYAALGVLPAPAHRSRAMLDVALAELIDVTRPYAAQKDELGERFTRAYLKALLEYTAGNQTVAARLAELERSYLGKLLVKHGIKG
jgi:DNA-binding NtrC family response regulator